MTEHQSSRTLVKSAPELWAECSDAASLARHLGAFGEIRITKLEPESTVAWEGAAASGTVRLEPSGWGTRVTLTVAGEPEPDATSEPEPEPTSEPQPEPAAEPEPLEPEVVPLALAAVVADTPRPGLLARFMLALRRTPAEPASEPEAQAAAVEPEPEPVSVEPPPGPAPAPELTATTGEAALVAALDSLGRAHHRPYSRA
jgi:hypothetical protein